MIDIESPYIFQRYGSEMIAQACGKYTILLQSWPEAAVFEMFPSHQTLEFFSTFQGGACPSK